LEKLPTMPRSPARNAAQISPEALVEGASRSLPGVLLTVSALAKQMADNQRA
jgi:hypothetical protein